MKMARLKRILRKYANGDLPEETVLEKLVEATPLEMWHAKLSLTMKNGISESNTKPIVEIINRISRGYTNKLKDNLSEGHPLKRLVDEHLQIKKKLEELEELDIKEYEEMDEGTENELKDITEDLTDIEKHEAKEENSILPRLKDEDVEGIKEMMNLIKIRHSQLLRRVVRLHNHCKEGNKARKKIIEEIDKFVYSERDHTFKENRILYPLAFQKIQDWSEVEKEIEEIGFVDFYEGG